MFGRRITVLYNATDSLWPDLFECFLGKGFNAVTEAVAKNLMALVEAPFTAADCSSMEGRGNDGQFVSGRAPVRAATGAGMESEPIFGGASASRGLVSRRLVAGLVAGSAITVKDISSMKTRPLPVSITPMAISSIFSSILLTISPGVQSEFRNSL